MTLYAQHGYGKADKLDILSAAGRIDGVVLSPADEGSDALARTVRDSNESGISTLLDPQTYVHSIADAVARCHGDHGLAFAPTTWGSLSAIDIQGQARAVVDANDRIGTRGPIIAPGPRQLSFADPWTPFAHQYARATLAETTRPVLASLVIEEAGLGDWNAVEQWLDTATTLDVAGFYVVIGRHGAYPIAWDTTLLANLLRLIYRLGILNDYTIGVGYADISGLAAIAAGATWIGSGWSYRQRQFVTERWIPRRGGQQAIPRVTSYGLLAPLLGLGEGQASARSALGDRVLPDPQLRRRIITNPDGWSNPEAQIQYLETLSVLVAQVEGFGSIADRIEGLQENVARARALTLELSRAGVRIDTVHTTSLVAISGALASLRRLETI